MAAVAAQCLGGWDVRKPYIESIRASRGTSNVLLLDSGDALPGTLYFQTFNSTMPVTYYSTLGYNATNIGSRDFDGGEAIFLDWVNGMTAGGVTVLSTTLNFTGAGGNAYQNVLKITTFPIQGSTVTVVAFANPDTASETKLPNGVAVVSEPALAIFQQIGQSKHVIMLSQSSSLADEMALLSSSLGAFVDITLASYNTEQMAAANASCLPNARICDKPFPQVFQVGTTPYIVSSPPSLGMGINVIDVSFDDEGVLTSHVGSVVTFNRTTMPVDPVVQTDLYNRKQVVNVLLGGVAGQTPVLLVGDGSSVSSPCRWTQCSMGSVVADAMAYYANTDIGMMEGGSLRANISAGNYTLGAIFSTLPFLNNIASFQIRGTTLLNILNHGVKNVFASGSGRFLQVSGVQFQWNPAIPATSDRIITVSVLNRNTGNYELLDTQKVYSVAMTNFQYLGGDAYSDVGLPSETINASPYGILLTDALQAFLTYKKNDTSYFTGITAARFTTTELTEVFVPTTQPIIVTLHTIPDALAAAFTVITGVIAIIAILLAAYIWYNREHAVTVIASPVFCLVILFGVAVACLAVFIYIHIRNTAGCMAFPWLGNYAFVIIFGSLFAKTWRIDQIFSRTKKLRTKKRAISNVMLLGVIGLLILVETFIMGLWQGLSPLKYGLVMDGLRDSRYSCHSTKGIYFFAASVAYKGLLMLWGMYLVVKTRNIDSDFRESTFIGWVIFAVFFTCAVIVTICLILKTNAVGVFVLIVIGFWIVCAAVIGAIFIPKVIEIWSNPDLVWATYFQRRAEAMRQGGGSVFSKNASVSHDSIHERMEGMSLNGLRLLLEEYEMRLTSLKSSVTEVEKDLGHIRNKIAKKEGNGGSKTGAKSTSPKQTRKV